MLKKLEEKEKEEKEKYNYRRKAIYNKRDI